MCVRERESAFVCVRDRECVSVCVRERECVSVCVCVCAHAVHTGERHMKIRVHIHTPLSHTSIRLSLTHPYASLSHTPGQKADRWSLPKRLVSSFPGLLKNTLWGTARQFVQCVGQFFF